MRVFLLILFLFSIICFGCSKNDRVSPGNLMPSELQKHTWVFDSALYINVNGDSLTGYALDTVEQTITFTDAAVTRKTGGAGITLYNAVFENPNKVYYWLPTQPGKVENMFLPLIL